MRDLYRDAVKAGAALLAGFLLYVVLVGSLPFGAGFAAGWFTKSPKIIALTDTIRITDSVIVEKEKIVTRWKARVDTVHAVSDKADSAVVIVNDSTVRIKPEVEGDTIKSRLEIIPPEVVADLRALRITVSAQDTLIRSLYGRDSTNQWRLATRDKLIAELSRKHPFACGRRCGFLLGVGASALAVKAFK
jgi:hypothetical protein